jgi:RNA polymerase sigma-70 factor (ECF subfamily)
MDSTRLPGQREPDPSDLELLRRIAAGDAGALQLLFTRHQHPLAAYLYHMLEDREDAEEAVADVFVKAWRGAAGFQGSASVRSWLYRVATHLAIDRLRKRRRSPVALTPLHELGEADARIAGVEEPETAFFYAYRRECDRRALRLALRRLQPHDRTFLTLHYFEGCSYEQICEITGASLARVKGSLYRARQRLKRHFLELRDSDEALAPMDETVVDPTADRQRLLAF